jgi:PAS domain S-box-containing protein
MNCGPETVFKARRRFPAVALSLLGLVALPGCNALSFSSQILLSLLSHPIPALLFAVMVLGVALIAYRRRRSVVVMPDPRGSSERARAISELREAGDRFQLALDVGNAGVWEWNVTNDTVSFDARFHEMLGYEVGELPGNLNEWATYHHPEDWGMVRAEAEGYFRGDTCRFESEHRIRNKSGAWGWIFTRGRLVAHDADETRERFVGIAINVTEQKRAAEALSESQATLSLVMDTVQQSIFWKDTEGRYLGCNRVFANAVGLSDPAEIVGKTDFDLPWPQHEAEAYRADDREVLEHNRPKLHIVEQLQQADGTRIWIDTSKTPLRNSDGVPFAVLGVYEDITERKTTQEALEREQSFTRALLESLPGIFYLYTYPELRLAVWNRNHETLLGFAPGEIKDRHITAWHPPELADAVLEAVDLVMKQGQNAIESPLLTKDGSGIPFLMTGVRFEAQGQLFMMGVGIDISDRQRAEMDRKQLEDQLRQSQKMEAVGQLAGGIAHDFNNLLQVILGNMSILQSSSPAETADGEMLEEVRKAAQRAAELTRQLLAFSRRQIIQPTDLDMNDLVQSALKMLRRVIGEHIELRFMPGLNLATIHADKGQMEQILMNLCVNARDAMPAGGVLTIETENVEIGDAYYGEHPWSLKGEYVLLAVTDTGHGMDEATRTQIFEPFFTTKNIGEGTGLGLATVYGIVKQHGGSINVYSEPGKGTIFKIYLPTVKRPAESITIKPEKCVKGGTETILVAEDEDMVRKLVVRILENAGYRVLSARDGDDALRLYEEYADEIDMILLDVMMPKLGGREVMDRIQARRPQMPVLFSSGYSQNAVHTGFVISEGLRLISKPYSDTDLLMAVRETLDTPRNGKAEPGTVV